MKTLIFASQNEHKADEIRKLLPAAWKLKTLNDLKLAEEIEETGTTLEENALIKARFVFNTFGMSCFADDTGLEVHSLAGEPGVYSARYAGEEKSAKANMQKLLGRLEGGSDRKARFRTAISYINEEGQDYSFEGIVQGDIALSEQGSEGFGYDPIFIPEGYDQSFAQMSQAEKNQISHRARALASFLSFLASEKS